MYIGSEKGVYAYGAVSAHPEGQPPWRFQTGGKAQSPPVVVDGLAYVGSNDGHVYALDASTGDLLWRQEVGSEVYLAPVVVEEVVYAGSRNGFVYGFEASTGDPIWEFNAESTIYSPPMVVGGVAYVYAANEYVYAVEALTRDLLWQYRASPYPSDSETISHLEVDGGVVYIGSFSYSDLRPGFMTALEASSGDLIWQYETSSGGRVLAAAVDGPMVYVGSNKGNVYALLASNGSLLWQFEGPSSQGNRILIG